MLLDDTDDRRNCGRDDEILRLGAAAVAAQRIVSTLKGTA